MARLGGSARCRAMRRRRRRRQSETFRRTASNGIVDCDDENIDGTSVFCLAGVCLCDAKVLNTLRARKREREKIRVMPRDDGLMVL